MEPIIEPVSRSLLLAELTPERKVRNTNKASNEIYIFDHWVLKPQNGILWQRTFFEWLDKWLKPAEK